MSMYFYHVLLPVDFCLKVGALTYTASIEIAPGTLVKLPFRNKASFGIVVEKTLPPTQVDYKILAIEGAYDQLLSAQQIVVAQWMALYYGAPLLKTFLAFLPRDQWKISRISQRQLKHLPQVEASTENHVLTADQQGIVDQIAKSDPTTWLLHGVTGSGKTEIYLQVAKAVLAQGKQVMILVPEIALTPQTCARFEARFPNQVAILHSGVTTAGRRKLFQEIRSGIKNVVLGARSALFAPAFKLGLIIVDEEHEASYHQEQSPRYHAVAVARELRQKTDSILILGSATPRLTTVVDREQRIVRLPERVNGQMPHIELIDMRNELKARNFSPISQRLQEEIQTELQQQKQVLLFLNRRGFATSYLCRECGKREVCPECDISLTVHLKSSLGGYDPEAKLICHYCGFSKVPPSVCGHCGSVTLKALGSGTQRILMELEQLFPTARIVRVDKDTMTSPEKYYAFYQDVLDHKYDIILGTQMIAKGLHLPKVSLVGVLLADLSFHFPEYTAQEKTFQILTQVAGRAGRSGEQGKVLIQTYDPDYDVLKHVVGQDFEAFKQSELSFRQEFWYPPFCNVIRLTVYDEKVTEAAKKGVKLLEMLEAQKIARNLQYEVLGPAPTWQYRRVGQFAYQVMVKSPLESQTMEHLVTFLPPDVMIDRE